MTHDDLVQRAAHWLRNTRRCAVVVTRKTMHYEQPDAIGWHASAGASTLIECKASRPDFIADRKKWFREWPEKGMGTFRFFMTPPALVSADELPNRWGLLEVYSRIVKVVRDAKEQDRHYRAEFARLVHRVQYGPCQPPDDQAQANDWGTL